MALTAATTRRGPPTRGGVAAALLGAWLALVGSLGDALAQSEDLRTASPPPKPRQTAAPAPASLEPPEALTATTVPYPSGAPAHDGPITVRVIIRVGPDGKVSKVTLARPGLPIFDNAVRHAAGRFMFRPARYGGKPVTVDIRYAHTFLPPRRPTPKTTAATGPPRNAMLVGRLREKGTRLPVQRATVAVGVSGRRYTTLSDKRGRFRLKVPAGRARVTIHGTGYLAFLQMERLRVDESLKVAYLVERDSYDPYEIVVYSERRRTEVSRTTLRGRELTQVPGTFGDPFRVIQTLPGVSSIMALLPFPVVRGASPGSTGFLIDGVRVPLLYHLLAGPSVIHPAFIDEISFYPGGFPVPYGGYTAGIIDGRTRRARKDEKLADIDLNFLQTGVMLRHPVPGMEATATAAGRIGYPGVLMSLATDDASLSYWDYQLRLDGGTRNSGYTVFAFGASDEVTARPDEPTAENPDRDLEPVLRLSFHRLDLRYQHERRRFGGLYRLVFGLDDTVLGPEFGLRSLIAEPRARWSWRPKEGLDVRFGFQGLARDTSVQSPSDEAAPGPDADVFADDLSKFYSGSVWVEALWRPWEDLLVRPGLRTDVLYDGHTTAPGFDPRLTWRYRLGTPGLAAEATATARDDQALWVKGGVGLFHQPPRFFLPVPGLDTMPLRYGLLEAIQTTLGVEMPLSETFSLDAQLFYNHMDPVIFDFEINSPLEDVQRQAPTRRPGELPDEKAISNDGEDYALDQLLQGQLGRAYGLEILLRRKARNGVFGWLSYTLSLSERHKDGSWVAFDFDRTHLLNLVAGIPLPRNWEVGARFQYQSGKPATTTFGYNSARGEGYMRIDVRIDKRAVWREWLLDFYVDIGNVTLFPEEVATGATIRYVLPTVGFRARL